LKQTVLNPSVLLPVSLVQESAGVTRTMGASVPGCATELNVVPVTPAHTENELEIDCSISSSCAGVPGVATVRITGEAVVGNEVLH